MAIKRVSPHIRELRGEIEAVATKDISVLIEGPIGTGKELIAKELHNRSLRKDKKFVAEDCGSIPIGLTGAKMETFRR